MSDSIKMMNLNYYFSSRHVRKKHFSFKFLSVYFVVLGNPYLDMVSHNHESVKEFGSRSDGRLTPVYAES